MSGWNPKNAYDIWCAWSALLESTVESFGCYRVVLTMAKEYYTKKGKKGIAAHINEILLKEAEVDVGDWENIRFLLHWEWDKKGQPEPTEFLYKIRQKYGRL